MGNIFSELSIWVLLGVFITLYSGSRKQACINIFPFCVGMLLAYYQTAELLGTAYSTTFVAGWALFSLLSPLLAFFTWRAGRRDLLGNLLAAGLLLATLLASWLLFDGPRVYDLVILSAIACLLLLHRPQKRRKDSVRLQNNDK